MNHHKASIDIDDLMQEGWLGLIEAADNFDDTRGAEFWTYARWRVQGAMGDAVREALYFSRRTGGEYQLVRYSSELHEKTVPPPTGEENQTWEGMIEELPPRERQILALHVIRGLALHRVGKLYQVTESRICQIVERALKRLRGKMQ
jgi:RNA polymerase sigma factor (sigma-70 family)